MHYGDKEQLKNNILKLIVYTHEDMTNIFRENKTDETFWFNSKLTKDAEFKVIFKILTKIEFKLACQYKLIN